MAQYDYAYDEDDFDHPLSESNCISQTRGKYVKLIIMNSIDTKGFKATSNQKLASSKTTSRGNRVQTPHSKMRDTSMGSVEVSTHHKIK